MINQTESQNPRTLNIDNLPTLEMLQRFHEEDLSAARAVGEALPAIAQAVELISQQLEGGGNLFYVGAGTSGRLAVLDAVECVPTFNVPPTLVQAVIAGGTAALINAAEGAEDDFDAGKRDLQSRQLTNQDVVIGLAASGRTPYVLGALDYATQLGAMTIGIANNAPSPVLEAAQLAIPLLTGPEAITGSTRLKAGTAQKLTLNMISSAVMIRLGKVYGNLMVEVKANNAKLRERAQRIVSQIAGIEQQEAAALLEQSNYDAKAAIVMAKFKVDLSGAQDRLTAAHGRLREVIG